MVVMGIDRGSEPYRLGEVLWNYLRVPPGRTEYIPERPADVLIMVLGSPDLTVAEYAANLLKEGVADTAVVSGGCFIPGTSRLEADIIADRMMAQGVCGSKLIREALSQNTSEHFLRTEMLLRNSGRVGLENQPKFVILVTTPVAERRALATGRWRWKASHFWIAGIPETYDTYMDRNDCELALGRMVGEIDRIRTYPEFEYMTPPDEPLTSEVEAACNRLRRDFNSRPVPDHCSIAESVGSVHAGSVWSLGAR